MFIALWFLMVLCILAVGFTLLGLTVRHWIQEKRRLNEAQDSLREPASGQTQP